MTDEVKDTEQPLIQTEEDPVKKTLSTPLFKLYTVFLFVCWADAVVNLCLLLYPMINEGFDKTTKSHGSERDASRIVDLFMIISQFFAFLVGIKARLTLDDVEQSRFVIFLRVLGQLDLFMLVFFIIVYFALVASDTLVTFEKISMSLIAVHLAIFVFLYFKALVLENLLIEKRKETLRLMAARSANNTKNEA